MSQQPFEAWNRIDPEVFGGNRYPLFNGIGRVCVVTTSERKLAATNAWLARLGVVRGDEILQAQPLDTVGVEPDWTNAVLVSQNKVEEGVESLSGKPGPEALVMASDIVVMVNGKPWRNLSRNEEITGDMLQQAQEEIIRELSTRSAEVTWDVATSVSRKGLMVSAAHRHKIQFHPIPRQKLEKAFWGDIPGALGRNIRIPLVENFPGYVMDVSSMVASNLLGCGGCDEDTYGEKPLMAIYNDPLTLVEKEVTTGVLVDYRMQEMCSLPITRTSQQQWLLV